MASTMHSQDALPSVARQLALHWTVEKGRVRPRWIFTNHPRRDTPAWFKWAIKSDGADQRTAWQHAADLAQALFFNLLNRVCAIFGPQGDNHGSEFAGGGRYPRQLLTESSTTKAIMNRRKQ